MDIHERAEREDAAEARRERLAMKGDVIAVPPKDTPNKNLEIAEDDNVGYRCKCGWTEWIAEGSPLEKAGGPQDCPRCKTHLRDELKHCTACGDVTDEPRATCAGDEVIDYCVQCGSLESMEEI